MAERIVEVEWEDATTTHGWQQKDQAANASDKCRTVGYLLKETKQGVSLTDARVDDRGDPAGVVSSSYGCTQFIPRSAIRKMRTLRGRS